jgi:hypothetical protein
MLTHVELEYLVRKLHLLKKEKHWGGSKEELG